ncbi:MAG: hypothetical protein A2039_05610 [Candidatus Melainabacteria bacterium GWA2_34_9]|nr:MAG: hypothetical protein A2039_05610 [Candidatus Melainabacteria bacterium GWA2_34_9]
MNKTTFSLLLLLFSPLILMVFHIIFVRLNKNIFKFKISNQNTAIFCELILNIPIIFIFYSLNKSFSAAAYAFLVYNSLGYAYFHFFNMSETARRIKILLEIKKNKILKIENLTQDYKSDFMVKTRLQRLIELNQIKKINEKYFIKGKILLFATLMIRFLKKTLNLENKTL